MSGSFLVVLLAGLIGGALAGFLFGREYGWHEGKKDERKLADETIEEFRTMWREDTERMEAEARQRRDPYRNLSEEDREIMREIELDRMKSELLDD